MARTAQTAQAKSKPLAKPAETVVTKEVAVGLAVTQVAAISVAPQLTEDALTDAEIGMLARGIAAEILNYDFLLSLYLKLHAAGGPHAQLLGACVAIAAPRLMRRNLLPPPIAIAMVTAGAHLSGINRTDRRSAVSAVPLESGGPYNFDGQDGDGQEQYASPPANLPLPLVDYSDKEGQSDLPGGFESYDSQASNTGIAEPAGQPSRTSTRLKRKFSE